MVDATSFLIRTVEELRALKNYFAQLKMRQLSDWLATARAVSPSGRRAKQVIENMIVQEFGGEDAYQVALGGPRVDWHGWRYTYEHGRYRSTARNRWRHPSKALAGGEL